MSSLTLNKDEILPDDFPSSTPSVKWVEAGYQMHEYIWWRILHTLEIQDWFVDTNGTREIWKNWQPRTSNIEWWLSIVNKWEDPLLIFCTTVLIPYLKWIKWTKSQLEKISAFINFIGTNPWFQDKTGEKASMLLWEVFKQQWAVCRHKSLIFKIICDELGIQSWIRWWFVLQNWNYTRHLWNEVNINGEWFIVDNAFQKERWLFKYSDIQHTYHIREWKEFVWMEEIWEWKIDVVI